LRAAANCPSFEEFLAFANFSLRCNFDRDLWSQLHVLNPLPKIRTIPLRLMNRPPGCASVINNCATWHCACGNPIALQGKSGPASGPTRESAVVCDRCARVYFVIPLDRSFGPPVEVVELFSLPQPVRSEPAAGEMNGSEPPAEPASNAPESNVATS
jgi:hypothetical protein